MKVDFDQYTAVHAPDDRQHVIIVRYYFPAKMSKNGKKVVEAATRVMIVCAGSTVEEARSMALAHIKLHAKQIHAKDDRLRAATEALHFKRMLEQIGDDE